MQILDKRNSENISMLAERLTDGRNFLDHVRLGILLGKSYSGPGSFIRGVDIPMQDSSSIATYPNKDDLDRILTMEREEDMVLGAVRYDPRITGYDYKISKKLPQPLEDMKTLLFVNGLPENILVIYRDALVSYPKEGRNYRFFD